MAMLPQSPSKEQGFPDRCVVIGGVADGQTVDVDPRNNRMVFDRQPDINSQTISNREWDYFTNSPAVAQPTFKDLYRKEFIRAANKDGTHVIIPFLVIDGMSTADAIRKVFYSYRTRK